MNRLRRRYMLVIPIALVLAIGLVAGAVAYWTGSARGTATAALAEPQPLTFAPGAPTSSSIRAPPRTSRSLPPTPTPSS